ncbi:MAG TPA: hypothetical protein VGP43_07665 [Chitinophagaceae bacterium]|nr:hypothetical protein [Chitinophagaceae bacterium]
MRILTCFLLMSLFSSCWKWKIDPPDPVPAPGILVKNVWGNKPIYGVDSTAKKITYTSQPQPVVVPGNIYAKGNYIFQAEIGKGLHVINNTIPSAAHRIGFITINGCSQISIKGNNLYSNNYEDLVVIDISDASNVREIGRVRGAFPEGRRNYFYVQPLDSGYYECPKYYDSLVIGWRKDSVKALCYKR